MTVQAQVRPEPGKKGSGGLFGLLGGLAGLGIAAATGGLAAPAAAAATGATAAAPAAAAAAGAKTLGALKAAGGAFAGGMGGGQLIGGAIDPAKAAKEATVASTDASPMLRRLQSGENKAKMEQLKQSAMAATQLPEPQRDQYMPQILKAAQYLKG